MNRKRTALPKFRLDGDFAAVQQGEVLDDGQPEAGSAHIPGTRPVDAVKTFEKPFEMLRWNALAVVSYEDAIAIPWFVTHRDGAVRTGKLDAVVDQVRQHLFEAARIGVHERAGHDVVPQGNVLRLGFSR